MPYSGCVPAKVTVPSAGARTDVRGGAAVERVDDLALVGDLPGEGPRLAGELAQLGPVPGERADHGDGEGQPDEGAYGDRPREVEPDDPGSVAPHDKQTEVVPAPQPRAGPSGVRSRGLSGYEHRVDDAVNGGWLRPHARMEPRKRRAGRERTHNQSVGAHWPAIPATRPALHVIIMARCRAVTPREIVIY